MRSEVEFKAIARGWGDLMRRAGRNVLPLFVFAAALQVAALVAINIAVPRQTIDGFLEALAGPYPKWMPIAVIGLVLTQVAQASLHAATRRVVVDEEQLTLGEAAVACLLRLPTVFSLFIVSNFILSIVVLAFMALGLQIVIVPLMLFQFVLKPSEWLAAARDRSALNALATGFAWSRTHWLWVIGIQSVVGLATAAAVAGIEIDPAAPITIVAFATAQMAVRFVDWSATSGLFIALDRAESP